MFYRLGGGYPAHVPLGKGFSPLFSGQRTVVLSNRGPEYKKDTGRWELKPGGLATAIRAALASAEERGTWIVSDENNQPESKNSPDLPFNIGLVRMSKPLMKGFYEGFSNKVLWPVLHALFNKNILTQRPNAYWDDYFNANKAFAEKALAETDDDDLIWVQDYHLMLVPEMISKTSAKRRVGFFSHIPFPRPEMLKNLAHRDDLLRGLLGSDLIGFHIPEYVENFLDTVATYLPDAVVDKTAKTIAWQGRKIQVDAFPISIDPQDILKWKNDPDVQADARALRDIYSEEFICVGVDRLDYTKGILQRIRAFEHFLDTHPEYQGRVRFVQVAAPSRDNVEEYQKLKKQLDKLVARINRKYPNQPVTVIPGLSHREMVPYFMIANCSMVTPIKDGMNLIAKESVIAQDAADPGVLILSKQAGAAYEMGKDALLVDALDTRMMAESLYQALTMPHEERLKRNDALTAQIEANTIQTWQKNYIRRLKEVTTPTT